MDGLRFDAVHAIGGRRAKGLEGKEFIARFAKEIRKQKPEFILFSENHLSVRAMQDQLGMSANWPNPEGWQRGRDDEFAEERRNLTNMWRSLTRLHRSLPALRTNLPRDSDVFHETLRPVDTRNDVVVIHRRNDGGAGMLIVIRFGTGADFERSYQIGCPASGAWREVFNTAWFEPEKNLGGEPQTPNANTYTTTEEPSHGKSCSLRISLPGHSLVVLAAP